MLGTGLIGDFYTDTLHGQRGRDRVRVVYSRSAERGARVPRALGRSPSTTTDLAAAIDHPDTDVVVVGLPELPPRGGGRAWRPRPARRSCARSRSGGRPTRRAGCSTTVEKAGVFGGYLEDLCYTPKTLKASRASSAGAIGDVTWVRSRETHPGPHSAWFWDGRLTGGGAIIDLGCHCIEIIRNFVGKGNRPVEVLCHTDTLVHPIADEDNAIALIRFESGAIGQFEVSWTFRGGMDLRDEVAGTHGTIWLNHFLRTGFEMFTRRRRGRLRRGEGRDGRRAGCSRSATRSASSATSTCSATCSAAIEEGRAPRETFYDGYVVNASWTPPIGRRRSRAWEPVELFDWRGGTTPRIATTPETFEGQVVIKREVLPDGRTKLILKDPASGDFTDRIVAGT